MKAVLFAAFVLSACASTPTFPVPGATVSPLATQGCVPILPVVALDAECSEKCSTNTGLCMRTGYPDRDPVPCTMAECHSKCER